ncbi:unnamed protein product [Rhizophagus irregularis]|nr:unnamed protein product [Rhizophagus irregularis]
MLNVTIVDCVLTMESHHGQKCVNCLSMFIRSKLQRLESVRWYLSIANFYIVNNLQPMGFTIVKLGENKTGTTNN